MKKIRVLLLILTILLVGCSSNKTYKISDEYYKNESLVEITGEELQELEKNKKSFTVLLYQPSCSISNELIQTVTPFLEKYKISFYKIAYSQIANTLIKDNVKYYPSVIIYNKGKIIKYLRTDAEEDTCRYEDEYDFELWFTETIQIDVS